MNAAPGSWTVLRLVVACVAALSAAACGTNEPGNDADGGIPTPPEPDTSVISLFLNGCVGQYCEDCKGSYCVELTEDVFSALLDTRVAIAWNTQPGRGIVEAVRKAREERGATLPLVGHYAIGATSRMDYRPRLPEWAAEDWYLHCEREGTGCSGQVTPECRCHPLFDLSEFSGIHFDMENVFIPNTGSISLEEPSDTNYGQNWYATVLGDRLKNEPFDILSLDMYSAIWPVYSVYSGGVPYLAKPVELDYAARLEKARDTIDVIRHHVPAGTLLGANGGQLDMVMGRFLPSLEEGRPLPAELEEMIQNRQIEPAAMLDFMFSGKDADVHPEWFDQVGMKLDALGADGWVVFPTLKSQDEGGGWASLLWNDQVWKDAANFALKGVESGKRVGLVSDGGDDLDSSEDIRARYYSYASFLLVKNDETAYTYISIGYAMQLVLVQDIVFCVAFPAEVDIPLGRPLNSASGTIDSLRIKGQWEGLTFSGQVYARPFENGVVLVNSSSQVSVGVSLPKALQHRVSFRGFGYLSTDTTIKDFSEHERLICTIPVKEAILPPTSALIFLRSPLEDRRCPEPW